MTEAHLIETLSNGKSLSETIRRNGFEAHELAPLSDWSKMSEPEHFVQFYESDEFLLDSLSGFIGAGLRDGDACVVVATKEHREGLDERLRGYGLDVEAARSGGQYVTLDADETLSKFMLTGTPEPERFAEIVGGIIARAAEGARRVRIFGEMVALLWAEGNCEAAIRLEGLWNELHQTRTFQLFCAYPLHGFEGDVLAGGLGDVCTAHSRVIPAESYTALTNADERLRTIIKLQQKARSLQAEIAERKQAEEALRELKDELEMQVAREQLARAEAENANRLKDEFLATVSHELRTPLNAIIGWSHMIRHGRLDETMVARAVETIERNAKSQAQLVEDILDVSRVITGKLRLDIEAVDASSIINAAIDSVQLAADSKDIRLEVTLDPSARRVAGDASRLQQVVWNLLSNAIKFTPAGGRVEVRLERADSNARIRVSDNGSGISADFLPFIFDRFRQADGSSTRRHGGLGLGLAIVRHLVELHGGAVSADSPGEGLGSTFTIDLPLAVALERSALRRRGPSNAAWKGEDSSAQESSRPTLEGVRVLLVDDDPDALNMVAAILTEYKASVQAASSAAEAFEVLQWFKPSVLVSDLAMPGEDGYALIGKVRAREAGTGHRTPAVALTAYVRVEDRTRALSAGFNMFVPKPIEPLELIAAIANLSEPDTTRFDLA
jgi:signal transduction histidine kinase/ActR/RegA family two-component response regulator